jgi:hypothetical protein
MAQGIAPAQPAVPVADGKVDVPELQQVTQDYIEKLRELTESFQHISDQSSQLEASADEVERLSKSPGVGSALHRLTHVVEVACEGVAHGWLLMARGACVTPL